MALTSWHILGKSPVIIEEIESVPDEEDGQMFSLQKEPTF
jgi:hypothetical protein